MIPIVSGKRPLHHKKWITNAQLLFSMVVVRSIIAISITPIVTAGYTRQDFWITLLIATVASLLHMRLVLGIHKRFPDLKLEQLCEEILGKFFGKLIIVLFFIYFMTLATAIVGFQSHSHQLILLETPIDVLKWSFLLVVLYSLYRGPVSTINTSGIAFLFLVSSHVFLIIFLIPVFDLNEFKPILYYGWTPILVGTLVPMALFFEAIFILHLLPMVKTSKWTFRVPYIAQLTSSLLLFLVGGSLITVFGPFEAENLQVPLFSLVRAITLGHYLERLEFIVVGAWVFAVFIGVAIYLYISRELFLHLFKRLNPYHNYVNIGIVFIVGIVSKYVFDTMHSLIKFYSLKMYGFFGLFMAGVIPLLLYLVARIRGKGVS